MFETQGSRSVSTAEDRSGAGRATAARHVARITVRMYRASQFFVVQRHTRTTMVIVVTVVHCLNHNGLKSPSFGVLRGDVADAPAATTYVTAIPMCVYRPGQFFLAQDIHEQPW